MNSLSWLIYAIGVMDSLRGVAIGILVSCAGAAVFGFIFFPLMVDMLDVDDPWGKAMKVLKLGAVAATISCLVIVLAPSRQTLLLIAGSEIGQRVVTSEQVQSVVEPGAELLREWIRSETKRLRGSEKQGG